MSQFFYKVVSNIDGRLWSAYIHAGQTEYKPGEWTKPPIRGSRLYLFRSLNPAKREAILTPHEVWLCEAEDPQPHAIGLARLDASPAELRRFWRDPRADPEFMPLKYAWTAASIRLIRKVWSVADDPGL